MTLLFLHPSSPGAREARTWYSQGKMVALFKGDNASMSGCSFCQKGDKSYLLQAIMLQGSLEKAGLY